MIEITPKDRALFRDALASNSGVRRVLKAAEEDTPVGFDPKEPSPTQEKVALRSAYAAGWKACLSHVWSFSLDGQMDGGTEFMDMIDESERLSVPDPLPNVAVSEVQKK